MKISHGMYIHGWLNNFAVFVYFHHTAFSPRVIEQFIKSMGEGRDPVTLVHGVFGAGKR